MTIIRIKSETLLFCFDNLFQFFFENLMFDFYELNFIAAEYFIQIIEDGNSILKSEKCFITIRNNLNE